MEYQTQVRKIKDNDTYDYSDDEDHHHDAAVNKFLSPNTSARDICPRDSIRSKNRSVQMDDFEILSPSRVQNNMGKLLKSDRNAKNNRHSIYRNEMLQTQQSIINQFIQNEIEEMKNHSNVFNKLSIIHKRKIKPNSRLFE